MSAAQIKRTLKIIIVALVTLLIISLLGGFECRYKRNAKIINIHNDIITCVDSCGFEWEFDGKGYEVGQEIVLKMNDCHTMAITDDIIEGVEK